MIDDIEKFWEKLETTGEDEVRLRIARHDYAPEEIRLSNEWLRKKEAERQDAKAMEREVQSKKSLKIAVSQAKAMWAAAIVAILMLLVTAYAVFRVEPNVPRYALVSKDGTLIEKRNFDKFGFFAYQDEGIIKIGKDKSREHKFPKYILTFESEPDYFEITTRENAVPKVTQIESRKYEVHFVHVGFGNAIIECNFKIQAY